MKCTAEVADGGNCAHRWMIRRRCRAFGFRPVPGTLNVHLTALADSPPTAAGSLDWFGFDTDWYRGTVNGVRCAVLGVEPSMPVGHKLELVASVTLRDALDLTNGDVVIVELEG